MSTFRANFGDFDHSDAVLCLGFSRATRHRSEVCGWAVGRNAGDVAVRHKTGFAQPAWTDRFRSPSPEELRESLRPNLRHSFDVLRKRLQSLEGAREDVTWYGDCWHWSLEYRTRLSNDPLAVLVPAPTDVQLALPLDRDFTRSLPLQRMKRAVRDGLDLVQEPYESRWGVWSITSAALIDELQDLVEMKLAHLAKRAG
jgi:hypothetical protein